MNRLLKTFISISNKNVKIFNSLSTGSSNFVKEQRKMGQVEEVIRQKLTDRLGPAHLNIINESSMHNVPKGSETHFKVIVVSDQFDNMPLIQRHRIVNDTLKEELASGVHALSIVAQTPKQWEDKGEKIDKSPACLGGSKR